MSEPEFQGLNSPKEFFGEWLMEVAGISELENRFGSKGGAVSGGWRQKMRVSLVRLLDCAEDFGFQIVCAFLKTLILMGNDSCFFSNSFQFGHEFVRLG